METIPQPLDKGQDGDRGPDVSLVFPPSCVKQGDRGTPENSPAAQPSHGSVLWIQGLSSFPGWKSCRTGWEPGSTILLHGPATLQFRELLKSVNSWAARESPEPQGWTDTPSYPVLGSSTLSSSPASLTPQFIQSRCPRPGPARALGSYFPSAAPGWVIAGLGLFPGWQCLGPGGGQALGSLSGLSPGPALAPLGIPRELQSPAWGAKAAPEDVVMGLGRDWGVGEGQGAHRGSFPHLLQVSQPG